MRVDDPFAFTGTLIERRFAVERVVARGGFGVVYQGTHLSLRKRVAIKVLFTPPDFGAEQRQIFLDSFALEAQTIAALDHPAVVRVFDFGVTRAPTGDDVPWMVLEWVEGTPLSDWLKANQGTRFPPEQALALLRPVLQALAFAHANRVVHRDVKPSNIMLLSGAAWAAGGAPATKLLDFGIAKVMQPEEDVGSGETHTHAVFSAFSLPYASPEQKSALRSGPWTDVHAAALVLTELLVGQRAYGNGDRLELEQRITSPARPTPGTFGVDLGPWEVVIAKALALRSADRFADAAAFLSALEATLPDAQRATASVTHATVPVRFTPPVERTETGPPVSVTLPHLATSRRRRRLAIGGAVAASLVAVTAVGALTLNDLSPAGPPPPRPAPAPVTRAVPAPARPAAVARPATPPPAAALAQTPVAPSAPPAPLVDAGAQPTEVIAPSARAVVAREPTPSRRRRRRSTSSWSRRPE